MTFKPAHKEDHPTKAPGQIVNPLSPGHGFTDQTLTDYIARKRRQDAFDTVAAEKKMTFEEWYESYVGIPVQREPGDISLIRACWKAAQENK